MRPFSALLLAVLAGGCSMDRSAGGSAETENSATARAIPVDSLLPEWNRPDGIATVAVIRLDTADLGRLGSEASVRDLDIRRTDGTGIPFEIAYWDPDRRQARLRARITPDLRGSRIVLWRGLPSADRTDPTRVWSEIPDSQKLEVTSVLVDDFENGSLRTRLPDSSTWFVAAGGNGTGIAEATGSRSGHALRIVSNSSSNSPTSLAAALIASSPRPLGSLDGISFWARGKGRILAALERAGTGIQRVAWASRDLDTTWTFYSVSPSEFDTTSATTNVPWGSVRDSVTHVSFWMAGPGEIWLDEVRLSGIDRDDLR